MTRNTRIKRYIYRLCLILLVMSPAIIVCVLLNVLQPKSPTDARVFSDPQSKTLNFFYNIVVYFLTSFVIFAFADSLFLRVGLFDRAPTPDRIVFNKEDDRLLLQGSTRRIIGDDSSIMLDRSHQFGMSRGGDSAVERGTGGVDHRNSLLSRIENSTDYALTVSNGY